MPDLEHKFEALESQLSTQHTAIGNALNSILAALGAPPPTATTTLADISTQLSALNDTLAGIISDNRDFYASNLDVLGLINTNLDTMLNNNSLNTQRLLIAIAANDPCKVCDVVPLLPPPLDVTPQTVDQDHCKRMQALIYSLERLTVKLDALSSFGVGFSPTVIRDAFSEVITELGVVGELEYPSLGEVAQIAGAAAAYVVSNIFSSNSLPANFLSIKDQLLVVLYDTNSASAGQSAYRSFLDGSGLPSAVVQLFKAMAYTSLFNLYYDSSNTLDLSGYDGTICAPSEIVCATGISFHADDGTWQVGWNGTALEPFLGVGMGNSALDRNLAEYTVTVVSNPGNIHVVSFGASEGAVTHEAPYTVPKDASGPSKWVYVTSDHQIDDVTICANPNPSPL
jgi:hypothetical protein